MIIVSGLDSHRLHPTSLIRLGVGVLYSILSLLSIAPIQAQEQTLDILAPEEIRGSSEHSIWGADSLLIIEESTRTPIKGQTQRRNELDAFVIPYQPFAYQAIKSNLLSDLLLIPNISAELYIADGWSISGCWSYSWWNIAKKDIFRRFYGGDLSVRYHIPSADRVDHPLLGHHIGLYAGLYSFDFKLGESGYIGKDWKPYGGVSYSYTYLLRDHWAIEFLIGVGYTTGQYDHYKFEGGCYAWQETKRYSYWGPTKAEISIVWLLNLGKRQKGEKL